MGYMEHNRACAAVMTRLEAGLLTELSCLPWAMGHLEHAQVQGVAAGGALHFNLHTVNPEHGRTTSVNPAQHSTASDM